MPDSVGGKNVPVDFTKGDPTSLSSLKNYNILLRKLERQREVQGLSMSIILGRVPTVSSSLRAGLGVLLLEVENVFSASCLPAQKA